MAAYKVISDIEAEDKLLGPLSFRQFIYAGVGGALLFLAWFVASNGAIFLSPIFLPPAALAGFLAFPWKRDQPTEMWALAKVRFMVKPRKRVWDQSGVNELVTITAPKRDQRPQTNNLSQTEVKSRLRALADTLDSHGWVIKQTGALPGTSSSDPDRLVNASAFQQPEPQEVAPAEDMFDEQNNNARRVSNLVNASSKKRRQKVMEELNKAQDQPQQQQPKDYWFLNQPNGEANVPDDKVTFNTQVVAPQNNTQQPSATPGATAQQQTPVNEDELVKELDARKQESPMKSYYEHMHKVMPLSEQKKQTAAKAREQAKTQTQTAPQPAAPANTQAQQQSQPQPTKAQQQQPSPKRQAAMRRLAGNNDLSVATIAREANEVVVKLH